MNISHGHKSTSQGLHGYSHLPYLGNSMADNPFVQDLAHLGVFVSFSFDIHPLFDQSTCGNNYRGNICKVIITTGTLV